MPDPVDPDYPDPEPTPPPMKLPKFSTHGTGLLPPGTSQLVFRVPNPETSNNGSSRLVLSVTIDVSVARTSEYDPVGSRMRLLPLP